MPCEPRAQENIFQGPSVWWHPAIVTTLATVRPEYCEFQANLHYLARSVSKVNNKGFLGMMIDEELPLCAPVKKSQD